MIALASDHAGFELKEAIKSIWWKTITIFWISERIPTHRSITRRSPGWRRKLSRQVNATYTYIYLRTVHQ